MAACNYCCRGAREVREAHQLAVTVHNAANDVVWELSETRRVCRYDLEGIIDSMPDSIQRTMFKHDCSDVLK